VRRLSLALLVLVLLGGFGYTSVTILDERQQAFRTRLGSPETLLGAALKDPGPYISIPGLHELHVYDKRLLRYDAEPRALNLVDKTRIEVDFYIVWRIEDPELRRSRVAGGRPAVLSLLDDCAFNALRDELARQPIDQLLSESRRAITRSIAVDCDERLRPRGISIADLQIRDARYPDANLATIYQRMRTERERFAKRYRAEGEEEARKVRSAADRESRVLRADAERQSLTLRGTGDADAARIYAEAYDQDKEFYSFVRSLQAYERALDDQTTLVLSPELPFLRYLFRDVSAPPGRR
jgi:membrane protease subunit HflC